MIPNLAIQAEEPVEVHVQKLAIRVCGIRVEMDRVHLELNLQIAELQLKAQPSTPPEVRQHCTTSVTTTMAVADNGVKY